MCIVTFNKNSYFIIIDVMIVRMKMLIERICTLSRYLSNIFSATGINVVLVSNFNADLYTMLNYFMQNFIIIIKIQIYPIVI